MFAGMVISEKSEGNVNAALVPKTFFVQSAEMLTVLGFYKLPVLEEIFLADGFPMEAREDQFHWY